MINPAATEESTPFDDGALYDLFFERFDYGLDFYLELARAAHGAVLDVACGTGRVLLPCLQAGIDIEGLDLFPAMLVRLREKAGRLNLQPQLYKANMSSFAFPRRYALIMIPFNAFVHNLTVEDQLATLECCRKHLTPGGLLAFDTFFPGATLITAPDGAREMEMEVAHPQTGLPVRLYDRRTFKRVEQLQESHIDIEILDASGQVLSRHRSRTTIRWIYKSEMELLVRLAGFGHWKIQGGFDGRPLVKDTDAMIVQAWTTPGRAA